MLKKSLRLTKNKEFDQIFKTGHSFFGDFLGIKVLTSVNPRNKFGVLVGLKVSKAAVVRNLVKRRIKAVLATEKSKLKPGYSLVIITKKEIVNQNYQEIKKELIKGLSKLGLYV